MVVIVGDVFQRADSRCRVRRRCQDLRIRQGIVDACSSDVDVGIITSGFVGVFALRQTGPRESFRGNEESVGIDAGRIQRVHICIWTDGLWQDIHNDGWL